MEGVWALGFKVARPLGGNGREVKNWSVNLLHPYRGNVSLIGDAIKLSGLDHYSHKSLIMIGYEHDLPKLALGPLITSFEIAAVDVMSMPLSKRGEGRAHLVHPEHQVLRCVSWELNY